jgi:transposase
MPPVALPGGNMTATFLAHIAYAKCGLHLPLARIAKDLQNLGVKMSSSTLCDAIKHVAILVEPIVARIIRRLFAVSVLHTDGTGLKVLEPGRKGSHRGQFAVYCNEELTAYHFTPSKHGEHFAQFLGVGQERGYAGYLVADAASNMNLLYEDGRIVECGCWYHLRKKFEEARPGAPLRAEEGIAWVGTVFDVEADADEAGDEPAARLDRRRRSTVPLVHEFEKWMKEVRDDFLPDEELHKAVRYFHNHRDALLRFLEDGRIPISNNLAERELGVIGRGRKAYLFAGSDEGGRRLAHVYTVVRTCERLGIDPFAYLAAVLPRLSVMKANREPGLLDTLVPWAWEPAATP